jgi:hypothetical protein
MKTLPQYAEKSDIDLLIEAKRLGKQRLERIIAGMPTHRVGTRRWYEIKLKNLENPNPVVNNRVPAEPMIVDFIVDMAPPKSFDTQ